MARIRSTDGSLIRDRRGQGGGGGLSFPGLGGGMGLPGGIGKGGGGLLGLLIMAAIIFLPKLLGTGASTSSPLSPGTVAPGEAQSDGETCDTEIAQIICGAVVDVDEYWTGEFPEAFDRQYEAAYTVFYDGQTNTGCGAASSQMGPFYCPAPNDSQVYFDLDFLEQMQSQLGAGGDFAAQYIVAHEYGHHVQNLLGTSAEVQQQQQSAGSEAEANKWSRALELQADCYAGAWAADANTRTNAQGLPLIEEGDIEEAINAAEAVGDDRLTDGQVPAEKFNHGTSEQRVSWFKAGFSGGPTACDTFAGGTFDDI